MKKRILSLILALSMVLSVFPLGAFAEGSNGDLVIGSDGYPVGSHGGKDSCSGNNWEYSNYKGTLYLSAGTFDLSTTEPVKCEIQSRAKITGGTFNEAVKIIAATITKGIFSGTVYNSAGKISGGTFQSTGSVTNWGEITGGTFAGSVENKCDIYGGVFNRNATLTDVPDGYSITWDKASSKAKITEVNDVSADWAPYVVVTDEAKTKVVTITADTDIYSLNGYPIDGSPYTSSYPKPNDKKTVTFTMPDENVVLSTGELVMGADGLPDFTVLTPQQGERYIGHNWGYDRSTETLILMDEKFDFSSTHPQGKTPGTPTTTPVACAIKIEAGAEITGGIFEKEVTNKDGGTISGGTFEGNVTNYNGTISDGTFNATVTNNDRGKITDGTFNGTVTNNVGTISGGTFQNGCSVTNYGDIDGKGTFNGTVENSGTIKDGTFNGEVSNNQGGNITNGTFEQEVINNDGGEISGGTFKGTVLNGNGIITGGTFAAGLSRNDGSVTGGIFNGDTGLTDAHHVTVTNGSLSQVNGVDPRNADGTTGTAWDLYSYKDTTVTITASTDIYSLNDQPIVDGNCKSSYDGSNKTIVKFTMPDKDVVLGTGDLVMAGGYPVGSNNGTANCEGNGWEYRKINTSNPTGTLNLTSGEYDFSSTEPVQCAIESYATISGGIFDKAVTNDTEGMISGNGTFKGEVKNHNGTISGGKFEGTVINDVNGTISDGTFNKEVSNINGNISNGTFNETVTNDAGGTIYGGTFAGGVNNKNDRIYGGVFNGNATLTNVTGLHSITVASGAKIEKVNDVPADWNPYVVVTQWTTATAKEVTITADTEIFSLNGQPIAESSYGSDKTTVTFTMPDDDVVLNKAITSTDLVMENGWPKDSNGGKNPCKGDGWEYIKNDPTNGDMLLLTDGLFDFSTIGDGAAVECNVFVGKPTAITGGEFNGKVFNNSGILGGTFHGEVDNMGPGRIVNGTFKNSVENNGMIENGAFHDAVKNNNTINDGTFHGKVENNKVINSGTFHDEVVNTTMGRIEDGMFNDAVENNGTIEKGTFHDAVKNNSTINDGTFNGAVENNGTINSGTFNGAVTNNGTVSENITGSGTLNGKPITKTPEPEPKPEPKPEPTTYTVTVIGGTIDGKTSVSAKENDTLTVVLDQSEIPDGMTFDMWSISSSKLSGDINVDYRAEAMTFQMPAEDVTIRAQYRSAEIIEDAAPSPLATAATIAVGGAAAGIVVWQGVNLGVDLYLANALPQGVPVPTDRRALALLLWETAGKPEVALPTLYGDIPAEEIELQKATRWAVQNGLMDAADKKDASFFDPDHYVTKMDVFGAWLRLKKLLGTIGTSPTQ